MTFIRVTYGSNDWNAKLSERVNLTRFYWLQLIAVFSLLRLPVSVGQVLNQAFI